MPARRIADVTPLLPNLLDRAASDASASPYRNSTVWRMPREGASMIAHRPTGRMDSPLVQTLFAALDLACDHGDVEIITRLSHMLQRLAEQEPPDPTRRPL